MSVWIIFIYEFTVATSLKYVCLALLIVSLNPWLFVISDVQSPCRFASLVAVVDSKLNKSINKPYKMHWQVSLNVSSIPCRVTAALLISDFGETVGSWSQMTYCWWSASCGWAGSHRLYKGPITLYLSWVLFVYCLQMLRALWFLPRLWVLGIGWHCYLHRG